MRVFSSWGLRGHLGPESKTGRLVETKKVRKEKEN